MSLCCYYTKEFNMAINIKKFISIQKDNSFTIMTLLQKVSQEIIGDSFLIGK